MPALRHALIAASGLCAWLCLPLSAWAELRGHGGPVRALVVSPDGKTAVSGGFDTAVIAWSLEHETAQRVLRFHAGAVNALALAPDGRIFSAGEDGIIAVWPPASAAPARLLEGHSGPVSALALAPDGQTLASASWDRTVRLWPLGAAGPARIVDGHRDNVNGVAFLPDGSAVVSAGYDAQIRITPVDAALAPYGFTLSAALSAVAVAPDGEIIAAGADGAVRFLSRDGVTRAALELLDTPLIALALSRDGARLAAAGLRGAVPVIDRASRKTVTTLRGPGLPVWSLAFTPDGATLLTGGGDRLIRSWNAVTGEPVRPVMPPANDKVEGEPDERGAVVFQACKACHALQPDDGSRAGPSLHGIFGRRIGQAEGYAYSRALPQLPIVWSAETIARLFEIGPNAFTPGTKMPEQIIGNPADRKALVEWLERVTRPR